MIVPAHWAEARKQHRSADKQITVRRFGWSDISEADALAQAEARAEAALQRILSGEPLERRERKVPYNGAKGVPIREEVLARHGEQVITRNAYGAHCLNSPDALFADIDFDGQQALRPALLALLVLVTASTLVGYLIDSWGVALALALASILAASPLARLVRRTAQAARGGVENIAREKLVRFVAQHPAWNLRLYRTPAGYRVLATHQAFSAEAQEAQGFFKAIGADPVYVRMCTNQHCFRARLTAKPWRIGMTAHMRPRPGVWPVRPEQLDVRLAWVAQYEVQADAFAACRYVESLGSGVIHEAIEPVVALHDRESKALVEGMRLA